MTNTCRSARSAAFLLLSLAALPSPASAQSNQNPNINVKLGILGAFNALNRQGTFPNGMNAAAMSTTVCNEGAIVSWQEAMDPDHPFIAFLITRESNGRFVQISDRSYVKHGFFAQTNSNCTPCTPPPGPLGTFLGVGCSDTYGTSTNGDTFWLGPPQEINAWLGTWDPFCSFFDLGTGSVTIPDDCDGVRSFTSTQAGALGPIGNRVRLSDADLNVAGASYWYQAQYVVSTEPEAVREDNLGSRPFTPLWTGSSWNLAETGTLLAGSVLQRWSGAQIQSNTNGGDDGRVYVATKVTGPTNGLWHYELAVHNRDNQRGFDELRIPLCPGARVLNAGFRDIDASPANDWTSAIESGGAELVYRDVSGNVQRWNTIYNFWFDSDAEPGAAGATLTQADPGVGSAFVGVSAQSPVRLFNVFTGAGCSQDGTPPTLFATGSPARATLGNGTFGLRSGGNVPGQANALATTDAQGSGGIPIGACTFWLPGALSQVYGFASTTTDGSGFANYSLPVPANVALEGLTLSFQALGVNPGGGGTFGVFDFSDGLAVRVGTSIAPCE